MREENHIDTPFNTSSGIKFIPDFSKLFSFLQKLERGDT
jgi:hypothetical protein